jgi:hypothetical protein
MNKFYGACGSPLNDGQRFSEKQFARLALLLLLSTPFCHAQDASCKVVSDATNLMARTPHHIYSTDIGGGRSMDSESISTSSGVYWKANDVWHRSSSSIQEEAKETAEANHLLNDCHQAADEVIDGQPAAKYSAHNGGSGATETVWIARKSGLVLKSEVLIGNKRISSRIEYGNIQAPPDVH